MLPIFYKGQLMKKTYIADFIYKGIVVETKSTEALCPEHRAQLFNYMRISKKQIGILINFGEKSLRAERYLYQPETDDFVLLTKENYMNHITLQ